MHTQWCSVCHHPVPEHLHHPGRSPRDWGGPSLPPLPAQPPPLRCPSLHACCPGRFVLTWPWGCPLPLSFQRPSKSSSIASPFRTGVSFLPPCLQAGVVPHSPWGATRGHRTPVPPPGRATDPCGGALLVGDPSGAPRPPNPSPLHPRCHLLLQACGGPRAGGGLTGFLWAGLAP